MIKSSLCAFLAGMLVGLYAIHAIAAENQAMTGESVSQKIEKLKSVAKEACAHCSDQVPDHDVEFPLERVPKRFLLLPSKTLLDQQVHASLVKLLFEQQHGWRFVHPHSIIFSHARPIELISSSMRITCAGAFVVVEYVVAKSDAAYVQLPLAYQIPDEYLAYIRNTAAPAERFVFYPELDSRIDPDLSRNSDRFFSLSNSSVPSGVKRAILRKNFPCEQAFPESMRINRSQNSDTFR